VTVLADDPTGAAVLDAVPCYPVPPVGGSPAIDALRAARTGHGFIIGHDGVMLILRRPWLAIDVPVTSRVTAHLPYGSIGAPAAELRCGLIPGALLDQIVAHFTDALPNEAAAFVIWNETSRMFAVEYPQIDDATPSRLVYRPPAVAANCHVICDVHSHGAAAAFFSSTDDADDAHATKIALVVGQLGHPDGPTMASRLCAGGMFMPIPRSPFSGEDHAA
jgi:PRTRC genetic system protein A